MLVKEVASLFYVHMGYKQLKLGKPVFIILCHYYPTVYF